MFKTCSTDKTRSFYEDLLAGVKRRGLWGPERRFDSESIMARSSVQVHFASVIRQYIRAGDECLDLGCGPGAFLAMMSPMCRRIVGLDVVPSFVEQCEALIRRRGLRNASVILGDGSNLPFANDSFDQIIMVDTIHHLERPLDTIKEAHRILRTGGRLLVFEPNKLNPLLALICVFDRNEHGLLQMGTFSAYRKMFHGLFAIKEQKYSGMLIGPSGRISLAAADLFSSPKWSSWLGWLCPKIFIEAQKA